MTPLWKRILDGLLGNTAATSVTWTGPKEFPNTYQPATPDQGAVRPQVFDPALKHFARAVRLGDPLFENAETGRSWCEARRGVMDHILQIVSESPWKDNLVLRGSRLLKAWLGDAAREPGDLDWVVNPATIQISDAWASMMFPGLIRMVSERPRAGVADIATKEVAVDDIWTYDRAPGRRVVFPWRAPGLPAGVVQFDVVFGEQLTDVPVQTTIPTAHGNSTRVWAAGKEQSLAWKILWLETDMYPQGKDLYDATLLAEHLFLPFGLLERTLGTSGDFLKRNPSADFVLKWDVDWDNFKQEYPWVDGDAEEWKARLWKALESTFAD